MICRFAAKSNLMLCSLLLVSCAGCGKQERIEFVPLSGKVTRGEQPLAKGRITLYPTGATKGPVSGAEIKAGNYKFEMNGGVPVGTLRVSIHELGPDPKSGGAETNLLSSKFNDHSKLEIEVKSGSKTMTKDFDLDKDFGPLDGPPKRKKKEK